MSEEETKYTYEPYYVLKCTITAGKYPKREIEFKISDKIEQIENLEFLINRIKEAVKKTIVDWQPFKLEETE